VALYKKVGNAENRKKEKRMTQKQVSTKLVRLQAKGQITLPAQFRRRLKVDEDAILRVTLERDGIKIAPLRSRTTDPALREYSQVDINRFLREDRLDRATAAKAQQLLGKKRVA
jgi:bifunctional DNA-binding transcriptional regulator/antitoxin component of YhaV-PrlF toxin-antitoxin module